jgi:hypothetical protein
MLDRDRKILWGRAGNRCALCRRELVLPETTTDPAAIVGDEAHIVARSIGGPRYRPLASAVVDAYGNRVLLCKIDHKQIDDQPLHFSESRLQEVKRAHEEWVRTTLDVPTALPVRVRRRPGAPELLLDHLTTGDQVWNVIVGAQAWFLDLDENHGRGEEVNDLADEFLDLLSDYADISVDLVGGGFGAVRNAKRAFQTHLDTLANHELVAFGGREDKVIEGGVLPPAPWIEATVVVLSVEQAKAYAAMPGTTEPNESY